LKRRLRITKKKRGGGEKEKRKGAGFCLEKNHLSKEKRKKSTYLDTERGPRAASAAEGESSQLVEREEERQSGGE